MLAAAVLFGICFVGILVLLLRSENGIHPGGYVLCAVSLAGLVLSVTHVIRRRGARDYAIRVHFGDQGLPYVSKITGARLTGRAAEEGVEITGNRRGLLLLAGHLVALAHATKRDLDNGYHHHVDKTDVENDDAVKFTISCQSD
jgi:hypothetical protein